MPNFLYTAIDKTGRKITSTEESASLDELVSRLQARDLLVINILPESKEARPSIKLGTKAKRRLKFRRYRVSAGDLTLFCRQLATLLGAGVTILKSLEIISEQVSSRKFYNVLKSLQKYMEQGLSLHEAIGKERGLFSELWVNLVESGEASGSLAVILDRLAKYLERNAEFKRKIISALIYPAILVIVGTGALLFLTLRIIPVFAEIFKGFDITLPLLTLMLISLGGFIRKYMLVMLGVIVAGLFIFRNFLKTREGRKAYEQIQFKLPLFGDFFRAIIVEKFSSGMTTLIESGVPILYSLEITEKSVDNLVMADIIRQIKENVREGKPLSQTLEKSGFFEPMVVQMLSVGEEIGELSQMFKRINTFYQEYVETFLARFIAMFEPLMLLFMGAVIGIMVVGMFLPIFQIANIR